MKSLTGRRILLIGGAGCIGHNLALELKKQGAEVSIVDSLQVNNLLHFTSTGDTQILNRNMYLSMLNQRMKLLQQFDIPVFIEDARNYHALSDLIGKLKVEVVFHLAAVSHASRSNKTPYTTFDHSFRTLENALDSSRGRVKHFVYFSSSMIYGNFKGGFVTEELTAIQ